MNPKLLDLILMISVAFFVVADIILALSLKCVLPYYVIRFGWYPATGRKVNFREAISWCPCLFRTFPNGTEDLIHMKKIDKIEGKKNQVPKVVKDEIQVKTTTVRSLTPDELQNKYPYLLSVYNNKLKQPMFECVAIRSYVSQIDLSKDCAAKLNVTKLMVRSESAYAHQGGKTRTTFGSISTQVVKFFDQQITILYPKTPYVELNTTTLQYFQNALDPKFDKTKLKNLVRGTNGTWRYAYEIGWKDNATKEAFTEQFWTTLDTPKDLDKVCATYSDKKSTYKVVVTFCHQYLAFSNWNEKDFCRRHKAVKYNKVIPADETKNCQLK